MFNQTFAEILRKKINPNSVFPNETYYGGYYSQEQMPYGTSHVSILAENGDAVAATDTINYEYIDLIFLILYLFVYYVCFNMTLNNCSGLFDAC